MGLSVSFSFLVARYESKRARRQSKFDQRAAELQQEIKTTEIDAIRYHSSELLPDEKKILEKIIKARLKIIATERDHLERDIRKPKTSTKSIMIRFRQATTLTKFEAHAKSPSLELIDEIMISSNDFRARISRQVE